MPPQLFPSSRAPISTIALAALGTKAEARRNTRKKKGKRKPPPPPLAVVTIAIQGVVVHPDGQAFWWGFDAQVRHVSGKTVDLTDTVSYMPFGTTQDETRAGILSGARSLARTFLLQQGEDVPADRIAAVML